MDGWKTEGEPQPSHAIAASAVADFALGTLRRRSILRSISCQFRDHFRIDFSIDFWSFFGRILGSSWEAFGRLLGVEIGHFWHRFLVYFWMSFRVCVYVSSGVWKCACVSPRGRPRAAKCGQKRPKREQNWAKNGKSGQKRPIRGIFKQISFNKIKRTNTYQNVFV